MWRDSLSSTQDSREAVSWHAYHDLFCIMRLSWFCILRLLIHLDSIPLDVQDLVTPIMSPDSATCPPPQTLYQMSSSTCVSQAKKTWKFKKSPAFSAKLPYRFSYFWLRSVNRAFHNRSWRSSCKLPGQFSRRNSIFAHTITPCSDLKSLRRLVLDEGSLLVTKWSFLCLFGLVLPFWWGRLVLKDPCHRLILEEWETLCLGCKPSRIDAPFAESWKDLEGFKEGQLSFVSSLSTPSQGGKWWYSRWGGPPASGSAYALKRLLSKRLVDSIAQRSVATNRLIFDGEILWVRVKRTSQRAEKMTPRRVYFLQSSCIHCLQRAHQSTQDHYLHK